jgi:hypothetical protein
MANLEVSDPSHFPESPGYRFSSQWRHSFKLLQDLKDGWDGKGTFAPSRLVFDITERTASLVCDQLNQPEPNLTVYTDGSLSLSWATVRADICDWNILVHVDNEESRKFEFNELDPVESSAEFCFDRLKSAFNK